MQGIGCCCCLKMLFDIIEIIKPPPLYSLSLVEGWLESRSKVVPILFHFVQIVISNVECLFRKFISTEFCPNLKVVNYNFVL